MTSKKKDLKELLETEGRETMVLALSAGIIAPEHEFSGPTDQEAIKQLTGVDISQGDWKQRFRAVDGDWPEMYVRIGEEVGRPVMRGQAIIAYMRLFPEVYRKSKEKTLPGAKDFLEYCLKTGATFGLVSGQFASIIHDFYVVKGELNSQRRLCVNPKYVRGGIIPSSAERVEGAAYEIIMSCSPSENYLKNLVLIDGNDKRLAAAGTNEWKSDLKLERIVKVGVGDKWVTDDAALACVAEYKYESVRQMYEALR